MNPIQPTPPFCKACGDMIDFGEVCDTGCAHELALAKAYRENFVRGRNLIFASLGLDFQEEKSTMGTGILKLKNMVCSVCNKPVVSIGNGRFAHAGGGEQAIRCQKCNWLGGDARGVAQCQSCGDSTMLVPDHAAITANNS